MRKKARKGTLKVDVQAFRLHPEKDGELDSHARAKDVMLYVLERMYHAETGEQDIPAEACGSSSADLPRLHAEMVAAEEKRAAEWAAQQNERPSQSMSAQEGGVALRADEQKASLTSRDAEAEKEDKVSAFEGFAHSSLPIISLTSVSVCFIPYLHN